MSRYAPIPPETEQTGKIIVDAALTVHKALGPGLLESVYEACLAHELRLRGLEVKTQEPISIHYKGLELEAALRLDLLVGGQIIVELKAVEALQPIHKFQLLTYLKMAHLRLGYLINFNVGVIRDGIERMIL